MTAQQRRRIASYQSILDHFDAHPDVWSAKPPVGKAIDAWRALLDDVAEQVAAQARDTTGKTRSRDQQEELVIDQTMTAVQRLRAYAKLEGDAELLPAVDVSESELVTMSDADLVATVGRITAAARERPEADLAPYEVTPPLLDALDAEAVTLLPQTSERDAAEDTRTVATARLAALVQEFPPLRDTLDDLVDGLIGDADFRDGYYQARKVDDG